jgi:hypothetical protein
VTGPRRPGTWFFALGTLGFVSAAVVLAWKVRVLSSEISHLPPSVDPCALVALLNTALPSGDGAEIRLGEIRTRYLVLYIFTLQDCFGCLPELTDLNQLERRPDTRVFGLLAFASSDEAQQTRRNFGLKFPVLLDTDGHLLRGLRVPKTPWKLVIRLSDKRIIYEDPPSVGLRERGAFLDRVEQLAP